MKTLSRLLMLGWIPLLLLICAGCSGGETDTVTESQVNAGSQVQPGQTSSQSTQSRSNQSASGNPTDTNRPTTESGVIYEDDKYAPFNRHMDVHGIRLFVLDDVSDGFVIKISRTLASMWRDTDQIDRSRRTELRFQLEDRYVYQRIGYGGPDFYGGEPLEYPEIADRLDHDAREFAHNHIDYIWEKDERESDRQIIEVIEHLLHTLTDQGFRFAFPADWDWEDPNSTLNQAMELAIENGHYSVESYQDLRNFDPEGYKRVIATEFAFWMILAAWDMFEVTGVTANEEWGIDSSEGLKEELPAAYALYENTVATVLSPPEPEYILAVFESSVNALVEHKDSDDRDHDDDDRDHDDDDRDHDDDHRGHDDELPADDPRQQELISFGQAVSENTGPGCNIWTAVPCPEFPNFVKTEPSRTALQVYSETTCQGSFSEREYLLQTPKDDYVTCLINASKSNAEPYFVAGAEIDARIIEQIREAELYGAEVFGNWGPIMNILVRYGEPDVEYVAAQSCLYLERYRDTEYESCREYNEAYYKTFDDCCGALHETPVPLSPVRVQYFTYSAPEASYKEGMIRKTTLHEYVHVWQSAHVVHPHSTRCSDEQNVLCELGNGPLWLEEGTAEYFALYFAEKKNWSDFKGPMTGALGNAQRIYDRWGFTLQNSHSRADKDALDEHQCRCGGAIMYDMGLWGVAWLIDRTGTNDSFLTEFYPNVAYLGYQQAFKNAFGLSLDDFYAEFADWFDSSSQSEKLELLDQNSRY